jgi:membrane protease YdiL (CAAX protease family)
MLVGSALYAAMALAAAGIAAWRGAPLLGSEPALAAIAGPLPSLVLGLLVAALTVLSTRVLTERTGWARALRVEFRALLRGARPIDLVVLALASGTAEELLFRGALQPWWGVVPTSLAFGLVHVGPRRVFLPWTLWALVLGFVLGALTWATGSIVGAILAHVVINAVNLHHILAFDGGLDAASDASESGEVPTMRLVGAGRRRVLAGNRAAR